VADARRLPDEIEDMMTIKEILDKESGNEGYIYMYRVGPFWKAYQRSAYMFIMHSRADYMMEYRYIRCVARNVLSVGVPGDSMPACLRGCEPVFLDETRLRAKVPDFCMDDFLEWILAMKSENVLVNEFSRASVEREVKEEK